MKRNSCLHLHCVRGWSLFELCERIEILTKAIERDFPFLPISGSYSSAQRMGFRFCCASESNHPLQQGRHPRSANWRYATIASAHSLNNGKLSLPTSAGVYVSGLFLEGNFLIASRADVGGLKNEISWLRPQWKIASGKFWRRNCLWHFNHRLCSACAINKISWWIFYASPGFCNY